MEIPKFALSIRQPWAWLIVRPDVTDPRERQELALRKELKDVENRDWRPKNPGFKFRGQVLIHTGASKSQKKDEEEYEDAAEVAYRLGISMPAVGDFPRGGIVGMAEIVEWVHESDSPWFFGPAAARLRESRPLPFHPCAGQLGFFSCSYPASLITS